MRRTTTTIGAKLPYPINSSASTKQTLIPFSTSSFGRGGDGDGGRGRGSGDAPPRFDFFTPPRVPGQPQPKTQEPLPLGHGRGRGRPVPPPSPVLPSLSSSFASPGPGRGRGSGVSSSFNPAPPPPPQPLQPQQVIGATKEEEEDPPIAANDGGNLPENIASLLPGAGRGQPEVQPAQQVNRHARRRRDGEAPAPAALREEVAAAPKMSRDEALKHAMGVLARNAEVADTGGRGRGRGRGRGSGRGRGRGRFVKEEDEEGTELYLGNEADGERLAERLGPEIMSKLAEGFEEVGDRVLPPTIEQMHMEALDMNLKLECEPEFLMGDLERNPDIHEKPPIPLRDALEKAKPFLMAYENIESQEEWEEIMKETMERVPLLKEIVDHYSGPGRVTAKKQHQELDRVAKTLPGSAPNSVKQFTERAVLSLQSNPGWGFHRKCQFMDKLVWRMSQRYK